MGRNKKTGLDYYPFDVDFFQDIKIRKLIRYQGGQAIAVYALLLCSIYRGGYYVRWDEELPFIISEQTGYKEAYIREVITSCRSIGLFDDELFEKEGILTSKGIQERYQEIASLCRRSSDIKEYSLISSEEKAITSEEKPISSEEKAITSAKSAQSKEKESKGNKIEEKKTPPLTPPSEGGGGKILSSTIVESSSSPLLDYRPLLMDKPGVSEDDIWEAMRLRCSYTNDLIRQWCENPSICHFYEIIQQLQRLEQQGKIKTRWSHEDFFVWVYVKTKCLQKDYDEIAKKVGGNAKNFADLKMLVAECRKGKIKQPGRFILSKLK